MKNSGFTLLEFAIVALIIGLIASGVLVGQDMIEQAEQTSLISEMEDIKRAVKDFEKRYGSLPGDMWDAEQKIGNNAAGSLNGDGDGIISAASGVGTNETLVFWQHLALAGLIRGSYDGISTAAGTGIMQSAAMDNVVFTISANSTDIVLTASLFNIDTALSGNPFLLPVDAGSIDTRFDDGHPETGLIRAAGTSATGTSCYNAVSKIYNSTFQDENACTLSITIKTIDNTNALSQSATLPLPTGCTNSDGSSATVGDTRSCDCSNLTTSYQGTLPDGSPCNCPGGRKGACVEECDATGVWKFDPASSPTCTYSGCEADNLNVPIFPRPTSGATTFSIAFAATAFGATVTGACPAGYEQVNSFGEYDTDCPAAGYNFPLATCSAPGSYDVDSDGISDGWENASGHNITGGCSRSRCCGFVHTNGAKSFTFPVTQHGTAFVAPCPTGFSGTGASATCTAGAWSAVTADTCI
jgi:prepilin-type N-terminal cleavage/methylation domain-containing protein